MRVLLLADTNSEHTEKWALGLASLGIEVGLFSFDKASYNWYNNHLKITLLYEPNIKANTSGLINKFSYLKYVIPLKKSIQQFKPDVLHAHYATSYGLVGALSGFKSFVISAWGTDVMKFPQKNWINKSILKFNLKKAKAICATSYTIKEYLKPVTNRKVEVIPFGVDVDVFCKKDVNSIFINNELVIGTIKSLEKIYNIDILIHSFFEIKTKYPSKKIKLLIVGVGSEKQNLVELVNKLNLSEEVIFAGRIPHNKIADYFNMLDVMVNISNYESFGVSVIEAMACQNAVVATNTGGLKEIIENENYGTLIEVGNIEQTTQAIEKYLLDENLRKSVGNNARKKVIEKYNWQDNLQQMIAVYNQVK